MKKFYKVYHNPALGYNVIDKMQPIEMQPVHPRVILGIFPDINSQIDYMFGDDPIMCQALKNYND